MSDLTPSAQSVVTGTAPTFVAAAGGGDTVDSDGSGRSFLVVRNGDASAHTVTIVDPRTTEAGGAFPDPAYVVAAGGERWIPLEAFFRNPATGKVAITYSDVTSVTVAVVRR